MMKETPLTEVSRERQISVLFLVPKFERKKGLGCLMSAHAARVPDAKYCIRNILLNKLVPFPTHLYFL